MRLLNFGCPSVTSSRREKTTGMESKICTLTRGTADGVSISQENGKKKKKIQEANSYHMRKMLNLLLL